MCYRQNFRIRYTFGILESISSFKGNIWSNLVLVFPKFTQAGHEQFERMLEENSKPNQLKKRVEDIKGFLIDLANENSWNITNIDENGIQVKAQVHSFQYKCVIQRSSTEF